MYCQRTRSKANLRKQRQRLVLLALHRRRSGQQNKQQNKTKRTAFLQIKKPAGAGGCVKENPAMRGWWVRQSLVLGLACRAGCDGGSLGTPRADRGGCFGLHSRECV